jgi:hypothetical protein
MYVPVYRNSLGGGGVKGWNMLFSVPMYSLEKRLLVQSRLHTCLPKCIEAALSGQIYVKYYIGRLYDNLSKNFRFDYKRAKISGNPNDACLWH